MPRNPSKGTKPNAQTKHGKIVVLLQRKTGASIAELAKTTGWQRHSVHGFMSGTLKKKQNISITSRKEENKDRRYFIVEHAR